MCPGMSGSSVVMPEIESGFTTVLVSMKPVVHFITSHNYKYVEAIQLVTYGIINQKKEINIQEVGL
jgi:hypothetical protein